MRLIDADALRDAWLENGLNERAYDTNDFLSSIDDAPTVEAFAAEEIKAAEEDRRRACRRNWDCESCAYKDTRCSWDHTEICEFVRVYRRRKEEGKC